MKTERIKLLVGVDINYDNAKGRKEAIRIAKKLVTGSSVYGSVGAQPITAKHLEP